MILIKEDELQGQIVMQENVVKILLKSHNTGEFVSEAFILESVNPKYDKRLFIEFPEKYKFRTCCVQILFGMSKQKQNYFCTQHVLNL